MTSDLSLISLLFKALFLPLPIMSQKGKTDKKSPSVADSSNLMEIQRQLSKLDKLDVLDEIKDDIADMREQFTSLNFQIKSLQDRQFEHERKIAKFDDLTETFEKKMVENTVVIAGLNTHHLTYSRAVQNDGQGATASPSENLSLVEKLSKFFEENGVDIPPTAIVKAYPLGKPNPVPRVLVQFTAQIYKIRALSFKKLLSEKVPKIYINEMLTKQAASVFKEARNLRRENVILSTWTRNSSVFVRYNANNEEYTRMVYSKDHLSNLEKSIRRPHQRPDSVNTTYPKHQSPHGRPNTRSVSSMSTHSRH